MRTTSTSTELPFEQPLAVGYLRNSKLNGRARGTNASATEQRRTVKEIAEQHGFKLVTIVEEEDTSGSTLDRPGWLRCRAMIADGTAHVIVAWDLDRMSRDESWHTMATVADIEAEGGQVFDRTGRITVSTAEGEIVATIRSIGNRGEWRKMRERNMGNVRKAIIEHKAHLGCPFGYTRLAKGEPLAIDPDESPTVERAFELRADGWSWSRIAVELNEHWAAPRPYKRHEQTRQAVWSGHHVRRMVLNRVYVGTAYNGEHETPKAHDAIVSQSLFDKANRIKGRKFDGDGERASYMLSGLLRCSGCGYTMQHTRQAAKNGGARYYQCQRGRLGCPAPVSLPAAAIEAHALDYLKASVRTLRAYRPVTDDSVYLAAEAALTNANDDLRRAIANSLRLSDLSATEQAMVDDELDAARARVRDAEAAVTEARTAAAGIDLPAGLNLDNIEGEPVAEQRHLIGLVFVAIAVRRSTVWRESVSNRVQFLGRNEAPSNSTALIPHVVGLDWNPASARVTAA